MIRSLRLRLAIGSLMAIGVALLLVWASLSRLFTDYVLDRYRSEMTVLADTLAAGVVVEKDKLALSVTPSDPRLSLAGGGRYWQFESPGQEPERSPSLWDTIIDTKALVPSRYQALSLSKGPDGKQILVMAQTSRLGDAANAPTFTIYAGFPEEELESALTGFHGEVRAMLVLVAVLLGLAAIVQAVVGLAPLGRLRGRVADIRAARSLRIGDHGPSEVGPLVREIDMLLEERENAVERARARASDLAHGLKTPLTVLAQIAAGLDPKSGDIILKQVDAIRQRADRQLQAARLGVERMATADAGALTGKLVQVLKPATEDKGLDWRLRTSGDLSIAADPADLAEAIGNLLDNAAKWARQVIEISVVRERDIVTITISDDGPGIPASERLEVLQRGAHSDAAEGGTGLGLAITADIAHAYGATLALGESDAGGLKVVLVFPVFAQRGEAASPA